MKLQIVALLAVVVAVLAAPAEVCMFIPFLRCVRHPTPTVGRVVVVGLWGGGVGV
jgi:hypothetical protein